MASEHEHRWAFRPGFGTTSEMYCVVPGCTATEPVEHDPTNPRIQHETFFVHDNRIDELEQQLAQARETIRKWEDTHGSFLRIHMEQPEVQQNTVMWGLLHELAGQDPSGYGAESSIRYCPYCNASEDMDDVPVEHIPDCPWLKARAFLAEHSAP